MTEIRLRHDAFLYESPDDFVGHMAPFLEATLAEDAAAVAVTSRSNWAVLRDALGPAADQVHFTDRDAFYVKPAGSIAAYETMLRRHFAAGRPSVRVVGEVQFGPTPDEWNEWLVYEASLNVAFAAMPAWIVCPYDTRSLPTRVVDGACHSHADVLTDEWRASPHYRDPAEFVRSLARAFVPVPQLRLLPLPADLHEFREQLAAELGAADVGEQRALRMLLAGSEVFANALAHGGGPIGVRAGVVDGRFVCEISDGGSGLDDPLAGFLPPDEQARHGAGLWVARQLVWRLDVVPCAEGTTVRLWL